VKSIAILLLFAFSIALDAAAGDNAKVEILSSTPSFVQLKIDFPGVNAQTVDSEGFTMGSLEVLKRNGFPGVPYISGIVAISNRGAFKGEISQIDRYSVKCNFVNRIPYSDYPEKQFVLDEPQLLRDFRIIRFQFFPVQYFPQKGEIQITRSVVLNIEKSGGSGKNERVFPREHISQAFEHIYKKSILNFPESSRFVSDSVLYLIITPDTYYNDMLPFVEWKEKEGIITKLIKFSDISSNPTYDDIRNYVLNAYNNWPHAPDYFLAVGDAGIFPVKYTYDNSGFPGTYANDNYYVALDSINDIFPDICGGRLPIQNSFQLQTVINKIINYESSPYMAETTWYNKAIMIASDEYPSQPDTKIWIRGLFIADGYDYVDTIFARNYSNAYPMRTAITNIVNEGRGFLNYRGPGWSSGWYASFGQIYDVSTVQSLNNGRKLPIVTSVGCGVAKFDDNTCFGEQWLRNGTPTSEKGAVSFFGPTWNTHTKHNNKLDRGIYRGVFSEGLASFGEATVRGKMNMYEVCGMSDTTITQMNTYLILGDPTLLLRTDVPESMFVSHDSLVPMGESVLWVLVRDKNGPVANAFVVAKMDTVIYSGGHTDSSGAVGLNIFVTVSDTISISVIAKNHFPYYGYCLVNVNGPWPGYYKYFIDDDTLGTSYGNNDGIPNEGEKIELPLMLKNYGNQDVYGVSAILSSDDALIAITDNSEQFGNIAAGDSIMSQDDYDFTVSTSTPNKHKILFQLDVYDLNDSIWVSHFEITVLAPNIELLSFAVDDSGMANCNGVLDPGETAKVYCRLKNSGSAQATAVSAKLRTLNQYIECIDSTATYGDLLPEEEKEGTSFLLKADSLTPTGTDANMRLIFSSSEGYIDSTEFIIKVGVGGDFFIWDPDENHSSGPKINAALIAAGYKGDYSTTVTDYLEILKAYKAIFICLGVYPNNYVLSNGQIVDSLCSFLSSGGRIYMEGADTWFYDTQTSLHPYFHIIGQSDGSGDTYTINGVGGTFTNQMSFTYNGENAWMDHLGISGGSFVIFNNVSPSYTNGIAYDGGSYKTVGTSFEFGGLVDGSPPSTKKALADSIMRFFGITGANERPEEVVYPTVFSLSRNHPNPFSERTIFTYSVPLLEGESSYSKKNVTFKIYDITGRKVKTLFYGKMVPGVFKISWDGTNNLGRKVSYGIYFARISLKSQELNRTRKIIFLK